ALAVEALCPFHYFGIGDIGHESEAEIGFSQLTRAARFEHFLHHSQRLGVDALPIKSLCFVARVDEAEAFTEFLKKRGIAAACVSGKDKPDVKADLIEQLESGQINYLISVDVFNEGIDIPSVNQVLLARPTQSAIVFVQQLGRGLRLAEGKEYLTVIDFIGHYETNFMIPTALYGDRSGNKDTLRRLMRAGEAGIPGCSTVSFDRIAKERVFKAIAVAPKVGVRALKQDYQRVKARLGRTPYMMDLRAHGELDPILYARQSQIRSLHDFACRYDADYPAASLKTFPLLNWLLAEALNGIHGIEALVVQELLYKGRVRVERLNEQSLALFGVQTNQADVDRALHIVSLQYDPPAGSAGIEVVRNSESGEGLRTLSPVQRELINDAINWSISAFKDRLSLGRYVNNFVVGTKYTYKETFRLLGWSKNPNPQNVGGYFLNRDTNDLAIFVNYHKSDEIAETTRYDDYFIDRDRFHWTSKSKRSMRSPEIQAIQGQVQSGLRIPLFIRKEAESEGTARYYLGELTYVPGTARPTMVGGSPAVSMEFQLDEPVPFKLYQHLVGG
ncbi:MAG: DUF3427 domain-containing protein, partial [Litorivicinus sp.]